ncbi:hypothetical protein D3C81_2281430 [compost metagenome]
MRISARSTGRPTDRLERMVESSDTIAVRAASSSRVCGRRMRSRIGLPYLDSPICRNGVSGEAAIALPSG